MNQNTNNNELYNRLTDDMKCRLQMAYSEINTAITVDGYTAYSRVRSAAYLRKAAAELLYAAKQQELSGLSTASACGERDQWQHQIDSNIKQWTVSDPVNELEIKNRLYEARANTAECDLYFCREFNCVSCLACGTDFSCGDQS